MEIKCLRVGELQTNCYLLWNKSQDCYIIDPGDDADYISTEILSLQLNPQAILLTHGHYDHCLACLELKLNFNIPIYLDKKDNFLYQNASSSANHWSSTKALKQPPTLPLPKKITLGDDTLKVIPIPGHTPGSSSFLVIPGSDPESIQITHNPSAIFVGDTIFADGIGRTDFAYSSSQDLQKSLAMIHSFPDDTLIYPGHENTPFLLSDLKNPEF